MGKQETDVYEKKPRINKNRVEHIRKRYEQFRHFFRHPNDEVILRKSYQWISKRVIGCLWGAVDGFTTGMTLGGKWATQGGWLFGGITQLVGVTVIPFYGMLPAMVMGAITNKEEVTLVMSDYRYSIGSTLGREVAKPDIKIFPSYEPPAYIKQGDVSIREVFGEPNPKHADMLV
ncbi:hypothetical protein AV955_gp052 [Diadromus pulchellus ascovirus 4a]|uniref:Complete DpAV4 genome n=1 Tax=Diadromus pulchellus ascovirus 4a TaxID=158683 RepID=F2NYY1_9VIRU|nr:hypothetical protein AV955_gp052 [Diadromus pulchellus ascovirus 4a]CCA61409.1 unnamed protein product [Diadromus pulchellus ascovirus 4a]